MKQNLNKATSTNYELFFPKVPVSMNITDSKDLSINISETVIPSISLETTEVNWQGGLYHLGNAPLTFDDWSLTYTIDSDFNNWKMLYKWITFINNNKDKFGEDSKIYKIDATLTIRDHTTPIFNIDFKGVFPISLGEVTLSFKDGGSDLSTSITLKYDTYEIRE